MFNTYILDPFINVLQEFGSESSFCINETFFTYHNLAEKISSIRKSLRESGYKGNNIGIITNDDILTYSSILAVWLEGLAYVPLNPIQPKDRNLDIITQAEIGLILDSSKSRTFENINTISTSELNEYEIDIKPFHTDDNRLAYILFTSGSTGKPKGVQITRGNLGAFVKSFWDLGYKIDKDDRVLQPFDLTFDLSIMSYLIPLLRGSCVYTVPNSLIKYNYIAQLLDEHSLTVALMVPSTIRFLKPYFDEINLPSLRYSMFCGEALSLDLIDEWFKCTPDAIIDNVYGPTEDTIFCSQYRYNRNGKNKSYNGIMSIGRSMTGGQMIIVNDENQEVSSGIQGELCLSGSQLTPGYWKNPSKNEEAFFADKNCSRFYKTGDICFKDAEGDIMFIGRKDHQVKVQGFRIELGEIEHHSREFLKGQNTVALAFENTTGNTEIALFVEGESDKVNDLTDFLKSKMPDYMVPSKVIIINSFPLNVNGKIDRNELKKKIMQ